MNGTMTRRRRKPRRPKRPKPRTRHLSIPLEHLVTGARVRYMCGSVTRHTLIRWRHAEGFPEPVLVTDGIELWDAREVRAWLKRRET